MNRLGIIVKLQATLGVDFTSQSNVNSNKNNKLTNMMMIIVWYGMDILYEVQ